MKSVCVVVLNYRTWQDTVECLRSLLKDPYRSRQIVVVDNGSDNDSVHPIASWAAGEGVGLEMRPTAGPAPGSGGPADARSGSEIVLIEAGRNCRYAAGNNVGIRYARFGHFDFVLILNNDTVISEGFLQPLVRFMDAHSDCGAAGPLIVNENGALERTCARRRPLLGDYFFRIGLLALLSGRNRWKRRHYYAGEYAFDVPRTVDVLSGACLLIRREALERTGLLDENTFLYLEEFIFHEKMRSTPFKSYIVPECRIVHKGGRSTGLESNTVLHTAELDSLRYYLRQYRRFNPSLVALIATNLRVARLAGRLAARAAGR
jgi:GT2 family glycosyltransferase